MRAKLQKVLLKDIGFSQTGPFGTQLHENDYVEKGTPIVTVEHLQEEGFSRKNLPFVSEEDTQRLSKFILRAGDIVFSRVGSVDRCTYVTDKEDGWLFSGRCLRVRIQKEKANPRFINFYFRQEEFKKMMRNIAVGAIMLSLNTKLMDNIKLHLLPISEQNKVAKLLDSIDNKIILNRDINAELEKIAQTLYNYWFVQFDFPDEFGRPYKSSGGKMVYNEVLKREIPVGWKCADVKSCIKHINTGLNPRQNFILNNGNIRYITVKNLTSEGDIDFANCDTIDEEARQLVHKRSDIQKGDILFASIAPLGRCHLLQENPIDWDINESVFSIRTNKSIFNEYLYMFFRSEAFIRRAENSSTGSVFAGIRIKTLESMPCLIPSDEILSAFHEHLSLLLRQCHIAEKENQKLVELRDFLLPMLMNGQVSVKS